MPEFTLKDGGGHFLEQLFWFWLSLAPFVLLSVPVTFYIGMSLFEDLQELPQQMANFSVQHAQCFCCSNGHRCSCRIRGTFGFRVGSTGECCGAFGGLESTHGQLMYILGDVAAGPDGCHWLFLAGHCCNINSHRPKL